MTRHATRVLTHAAVAVALAVTAAPTASARPIGHGPIHADDVATQPESPAPVVKTVDSGGFDWSDAGVGAAGALGLAFLAAGGAFAARHRRAPEHNRSPLAG